MSTAYLIHKYPNSKKYLIRVTNDYSTSPEDLPTGINLTKSDIKRIVTAKQKRIELKAAGKKYGHIKVRLEGNEVTKERLKAIKAEQFNEQVTGRTGLKIKSIPKKNIPLLSDCYKIFLILAKNPEDVRKKPLAPSTIDTYKIAFDHFVRAVGDIPISELDEYNQGKGKIFKQVRLYFGYRLDPGVVPTNPSSFYYDETSFEKYSREINSILSYARRTLKEKGFEIPYPLPHLNSEEVSKEIIPIKDLRTIINHLYDIDRRAFFQFYFIALTGCRKSTAVVQPLYMINLETEVLKMFNVKGRWKIYGFPIARELKTLLRSAGIHKIKNPSPDDRLFYDVKFTKNNYRYDFRWWPLLMKYLMSKNKISNYYQMEQLRETFISFATQKWRLDLIVAKILADHEFKQDITITHYYNTDNKIFTDMVKKGMNKTLLWPGSKNISSTLFPHGTHKNMDNFRKLIVKTG